MTHYIEVTVDPNGVPDSPYPWDRWDMSPMTWDGGWTVIRRYERARVCGPWRDVPNAD